jgi:purine-nucleoside phosphorylase
MKSSISESVEFIRSTTDLIPQALLILGTGMSGTIKGMEDVVTIPYSHIPNFPKPSAPTHVGELLIGNLAGYPLAVMKGRPHYYEGYSMDEVTFPIRVFNKLGAKCLVVTNAAGGLNCDYKSGDVVIITDHINFMGTNPLIGPHNEEEGPRFPFMAQVYDPEYRECFSGACLSEKIIPRFGVYLAVSGPTLETPAEIRFFQKMGADLIGMSTVPEVIVSKYLEMRILGISVVSNSTVTAPTPGKAEITDEINTQVEAVANSLGKALRRFFKDLSK